MLPGLLLLVVTLVTRVSKEQGVAKRSAPHLKSSEQCSLDDSPAPVADSCSHLLENAVRVDLGTPFFPGAPELWHHPLAAYSAAAELPGAALQHATLVHPALHPQVPVQSYREQFLKQRSRVVNICWRVPPASLMPEVTWPGHHGNKPQMSIPHPAAALTSIHASLPHFLPSPALASPVGSSSSQPGIGVNNAPCSTLFVANLGQFVSEHELKEIFSR
uniref:RRM domain-containing protein n=1 Tax=Timema shepardi TaxID=629360 RepID=A0A7R9FUI2_TIMSH|nr:unnamed protein product [Timema shepardi]